jgi:hypothetical protein
LSIVRHADSCGDRRQFRYRERIRANTHQGGIVRCHSLEIDAWKMTACQGYKVIAADVNIDGPIKELGCEIIKLDIASPDNIQAFKREIGDQPIQMLLNIAGKYYQRKPSDFPIGFLILSV